MKLAAAIKVTEASERVAQSLFDSSTDAMTSGLTVEASGGEQQVGQQEPHGEATRDSHQPGYGTAAPRFADDACLAS